tara:strand:+ start:6274 stop:7470 length:1197 start_codon:yes stop_codon:yes gene_type:complete
MMTINKASFHFIRIFLLITFVFSVPVLVHGQVIINEIAWMGTHTSSADEWIELYNTGTTPVTLDNWTLAADDGSPDITLSGTISGQSYFILERTDDTSAPGVIADLIYSGALSNSGEALSLSDTNGSIINRVDAISGWIAGDSTDKLTMQFHNDGWLTGTGTPKAINTTIQAGGGSSGTGGGTGNDNGSSNTDTSTEPSIHISPLPPTRIDDIQQIRISAGVDRVIPVGTPISFYAIAIDKNNDPVKLSSVLWTFGDGGRAGGIDAEHIYRYPGTYLVSLNVEHDNINTVSHAKIRVFSPNISISEISEEDGKSFIALTNSSIDDINITDWILKSANRKFVFPKDTIILSGETIKLPKQITRLKVRDEVLLMDAQKSIVHLVQQNLLDESLNNEDVVE